MRTLTLTPENLAVVSAGGHPLYLVKAADAADWRYDQPIAIQERPGIRFKRHLLMYETRGHREALELELVAGSPPTRADLLGLTLVQP